MQRIERELKHKEYALEQMGKRFEMEKQLMERLNSGLLDGLIGSGFDMGTFTSRALIEDGRPMLVKYLTEKGPIKEAMIIIREIIASIYDTETAENMLILYGGSVDEENSKIIAKIPGVDGAFVGGASLDPTRFAKIVTAFNKQMKKQG